MLVIEYLIVNKQTNKTLTPILHQTHKNQLSVDLDFKGKGKVI